MADQWGAEMRGVLMNTTELKSTRKRLGLTQAGFASELGLSLRTYARFEHGEYPVPLTVSLAVAGYLSMRP